MEKQLKGYVQAYGIESHGEHDFGMFIEVSLGRPLTEVSTEPNVMPGQDSHKVAAEYDGVNMQKIMEVYNLSMDKDKQLNTTRVQNY
jgi:hypothetical protein